MRAWDPHRRAYEPRMLSVTPVVMAGSVGVLTYLVVGAFANVWAQLLLIAVMTALGVGIGLLSAALQLALWRRRHPAKYPCGPGCFIAAEPQLAREAQRQREVARWQ